MCACVCREKKVEHSLALSLRKELRDRSKTERFVCVVWLRVLWTPSHMHGSNQLAVILEWSVCLDSLKKNRIEPLRCDLCPWTWVRGCIALRHPVVTRTRWRTPDEWGVLIKLNKLFLPWLWCWPGLPHPHLPTHEALNHPQSLCSLDWVVQEFHITDATVHVKFLLTHSWSSHSSAWADPGGGSRGVRPPAQDVGFLTLGLFCL